MTLGFLEAASLWSNIAVVVLTLLAAMAGVAALYFSSQRDVLNDAEETERQRKSAETIAAANSEAAKASARAAEAGASAAKANEGTALAQADAANALAAQEKLRQENLQLSIKLEEERLARVKIEERLADRILSDAQVEEIKNKVKPFVGQVFKVTTYWDMREPMALTERIHQLLIEAQWKYVDREEAEQGRVPMPGKSGVEVYVHPEADMPTKDAATALVAALVAVRVEAEVKQQNDPKNPNNKINITIGTKPQ